MSALLRGLTLPISSSNYVRSPPVPQRKTRLVYHKPPSVATRAAVCWCHHWGWEDLTLFDMKTGKEVDMGGTFDWFGIESHPDFKGVTEKQFANRMLLREIMVKHGFKPLVEELWHFTLAAEPYPDTYFDFPLF